MTERTVFLVRHAEPEVVGGKRCYLGYSNPCLTPEGIRQSEGLSCKLSDHCIQAVYSSDLARAEQTAEYIANKRGIIIKKVPEIREINMGKWDGMSFDMVRSLFPVEYDERGRDIANYRPPEGESFFDLSKRVIPAFMNILENSTGNIVIVSHAGVNRVIICYLSGLPLDKVLSIKQDYACINTCTVSEESNKLVAEGYLK